MKSSLVISSAVFLAAVSCLPDAGPGPERGQADPRRGEMAAVARAPTTPSSTTGLQHIRLQGGEATLLYVPASYQPSQMMPLVVMLHGAGGAPQHSIDLAQAHADRLGFIVLAPASAAATWDIIAVRRYGPDVAAIDAALEQVFTRYAVDNRRIAIAGFSDGASYALSLGLANGELFSTLIAFSPGFMAPARQLGKPRIFISHGVQDRVLPIDRCSRRLVPQLKEAGYEVDYREFPDGHVVPDALARDAFELLA